MTNSIESFDHDPHSSKEDTDLLDLFSNSKTFDSELIEISPQYYMHSHIP